LDFGSRIADWFRRTVVRRPDFVIEVTSMSTRVAPAVATWIGMTFCEQYPPPVSTRPDEIRRRVPAA
jgi:hypothetical protein